MLNCVQIKHCHFLKKNILLVLKMAAFYTFISLLLQIFIVNLIFASTSSSGQDFHDIKLDINAKSITLEQAFKIIEQKTGFKFTYDHSEVPIETKVNMEVKNVSLYEVLESLSKDYQLAFNRINNQIVIKKLDLVDRDSSVLQNKVGSIKGTVRDANTKEAIPGANIIVTGLNIGAAADAEGSFIIKNVPPGEYKLSISAIGYGKIIENVTVWEGRQTEVDFALNAETVGLDEVVVTGVAFETSKRSVPSPISIITSSEIETKGTTNLTELLKGEIPGVMPVSYGQNDYLSRIYIRGAAGWAAADFAKIYVDGVEVSSTYITTIDPKSIERIEVVRGPAAATIYGSDAASGVIQIFTKKGGGSNEPKINVEVSSAITESEYTPNGVTPFNQDYGLQVSGSTESASYRFGLGYSTIGEWVRNYSSKRLSLSGGLRTIQGPLTIELSASRSDREMTNGIYPIFARWEQSNICSYCGEYEGTYPNYLYEPNQSTISLNLDYQASSNWRHNLILGIDQNNSSQRQLAPYYRTPSDSLLSLTFNESRRRSIRYKTAYNVELMDGIKGRFNAGIDYSLFDYKFTSASGLLSNYITVTQTSQTTAGFVNQDSWNAGYFGLVEISFLEQFFLTIATRAEQNSTYGTDFNLALSPRVGISYVNEFGQIGIKLRGQYGRGTMPAAQSLRDGSVSSVIIYLPNPELGPEVKSGWDAGVELYWGNNISFALTHYREVGEDLIMRVNIDVSSLPQIAQYQNVGRVGSEGWEIEGRFNFGPITLKANYAYSENVIRSLSSYYLQQGPESLQFRIGDRILYVPKHSGGGSITVRFWNGGASLNYSMRSNWRALDNVAYYNYRFGIEPYRGALRDYYVEYPASWKWNFSMEQLLTEWLSVFLRVDNLTNNQGNDLYDLYNEPGRTTLLGIRLSY